MNNAEIADRFARLGQLMTIRGEDNFRIRAYINAAETIRAMTTSVLDIAGRGGAKELQAIPGVGRAISAKIVELAERGTFEAWERTTAETPESVLDMLGVDGVNVKLAATLYQRFKISSVDDLRQFVAGDGLELVDGVGEKIVARIKKAVHV